MTKRKRNLRKTKKKTSSSSAGKVERAIANGQETSTELLEKFLCEAESAVNTFNYEEASVACEKVLEVDPTNVKAYEILAGIHIENGNIAEAQTMLMRCVELCPEDGYSKYFSLGQLASGKESIDFYQRGIDIIRKQLGNPETASPSANSQETPLHRVMSDAFCSIAEICMTDYCFEKDAESVCKRSIESAIEADESNPEAYQCLANFNLVKGETEESKSAINKSMSFWLPLYKAIWEGEASLSENENFQPPSYDSRISTSKLLIELEMLDEANEVLEGLVAEDDEVIEVWYLLGLSHYLRGNDYKKNAVYYFNKAKKVYKKTGVADEDHMTHISELLEEMHDIHDSEDSADDEEGQENFPSDSEESDNENCDVEMKQ